MARAYLSLDKTELDAASDEALLGRLASELPFSVEQTQRGAWIYQIRHLRRLLQAFPTAHAFMEFLIPRMGRRADLVLLLHGIVFVIEYKIGAKYLSRGDLDQVYGYALDLKNFHETSHTLPVVPIAVATSWQAPSTPEYRSDDDGLLKPIALGENDLERAIREISNLNTTPAIDPLRWEAGRYQPTPTIIEAAQALYHGHSVHSISRSEAGAENLTQTAQYVARVIENAKREHRKMICFITGVPGSGKTLAGLNLATDRQRAHAEEHAVFLSGNGPLVEVLREALTVDAVKAAKEKNKDSSKVRERRRAEAFIQNIHHFRDEALNCVSPPAEKVVVFDEAQRAWDVEQTSKFMQQKRGQSGFSMSEPAFLLSVMDRHPDWCVVVCLVGGGQEINTGEAGIDEWLRALEGIFPHWRVHLSPELTYESVLPNRELAAPLHLSTSIRSFRAERLSEFISYAVAGDAARARQVRQGLTRFPLLVTRDLEAARRWLRAKRRGQERSGLLASSNAVRLRPCGLFVKAKIEPQHWFLGPHDDVRSSDALEDVGTEFETQGLELDWTCVCWDLNYRREGHAWTSFQFKGTRWQRVNDSARQRYVANAYRVLLTRARQGMIIFVPEGSPEDVTRPERAYDEVYEFLLGCGCDPYS
ncbi:MULTISPECIES: DUF2075 domain-containing protein [Asaia]|nr:MULTISPECIES: DUF2075 domain-containing protein [Asaia]MDL2169965.1 DUF2075 domain-containing protein [Asaia sp. HumB]